MAEPVLLKDLACWLGGYDLTSYLNSVNVSAAKAELGNGRFGDGGEVFFPGLEQITSELGGFYSSEAADAPDRVIWPRIDPTLTPAAWPLLVVPPFSPSATPDTHANRGYLVVGKQFTYNFGAPHGQLLPFNVSTRLSSTYKLYRQTIMQVKAAVSTTTTSTGLQLGALSATQELVVSLHVFNIDVAGNWTLTIESDDNSGFTTATTRDTFTAVTEADDPTAVVRKISGAVADDWWRAVLTENSGTSTITYAVTMGVH